MTNTKTTKRDNFATIRTLIETSMLDNETQDNLLTFIDHEVELLDKRAASAKKYAKKGTKAQDAMANAIAEALIAAEKPMSIPEIIEVLDADLSATTQKVTYRLTKMVEAGTVTKTTESVKEDGSKAHKVCFYSVVADAE